MSACHVSLGRSASKRISEQRGRFCGCGATSPSRRRIRQIVATEGTRSSPFPGEVVGDRLSAAVVSLREQLLSQGHDCPHHLLGRAVGTGARRPGAWLQGLIPAFSVAGEQLVDPAAMHAVGRSPALRPSGPRPDAPRPDTAPLPQEISLRWVSPMSRHRCRLSTETRHRLRHGHESGSGRQRGAVFGRRRRSPRRSRSGAPPRRASSG